MINLTLNSPNLVTVTLSERKRTCTNTYLFEFIDKAMNKFYAVSEDLIQNGRYNKFIINVVSASADNSNGEVSFIIPGQYTYNVYENPSASLSPIGLFNLETGIAKINQPITGSTVLTGSVVNPIYQFNGQQ